MKRTIAEQTDKIVLKQRFVELQRQNFQAAFQPEFR